MLTLAFAQAGGASAGAPQAQQSPIIALLPFLLIFVIFYFLLIKPQKKQQAAHRKMLTELEKNQEVVTSGGIYGTITNVEKENDVITLRIDDNTKIKVQKSAVARLKKADAGQTG
ncbi:MAG: preprotein translocase subunit YajC [Candidatus Omnitrophica bacterium]|nr:preprotein translocase subunit YajC [Candidatus Omnitrophota bacterium]